MSPTQAFPVPAVSVVIPSYNSRRTIERCLESLHGQEGGFEYEIVLADSSDDDTERIVCGRFPAVRLIRLERHTLPGKARNVGVRQARGGIIAFLDADCVATPTWLKQHMERHPRWDVVGGAMRNGTPASPVGWASYLSEFGEFTPGRRLLMTRNLVSANVSYTRRVFDTAQFPEDLFPGEDRLLHWQLGNRFRCCLDGTVVVEHLNRTRLGEFLTHQERLGSSAARIRLRAVDLPGAMLARRPWLASLTPVYRGLALAWRLLHRTPWMLPAFVAVYPLIFLGSCYWARAFAREALAAGVSGRGDSGVGR